MLLLLLFGWFLLLVQLLLHVFPKCFRSDSDQNCKLITPTRARFCPEAIDLFTLPYVSGHCPAAATDRLYTKPVQLVEGSIAECQQTVPSADFLLFFFFNVYSGVQVAGYI